MYKVSATLKETSFEVVFYKVKEPENAYLYPKMHLEFNFLYNEEAVIKAYTYCNEGYQNKAKESLKRHVNDKLKAITAHIHNLRKSYFYCRTFYR